MLSRTADRPLPDRLRLFQLLLVVSAISSFVHGQQTTATREPDVVRVDTELVQTSVTVLDKQGKRVDGLTRDDFELSVNGRAVPIAFFESVAAGSDRDKAIRDSELSRAETKRGSLHRPPRTVVFFIDDHHLSLTSLDRARSMLLDFIDKKMGADDLTAIASPSGRVGFLQQFTDNKEVLRAAVARLKPVSMTATDYSHNPGAPMTEYNAYSIEQRDDAGVFEFYVQNCIAYAPKGADARQRQASREHCAVEVRNRARSVLIQAGAITDGTYLAFEKLLRFAARMPGTKLAFFISDGFLPDTGARGRISRDRLGRISSIARDSSVVIYSIDAKGLVSGALDAAGSVPFDTDGRLESASLRAIAASQDPLNALAVDTGGRALRNQNTFGRFVDDALSETERFYLIAWVPADAAAIEKLRGVELKVRARPELTVVTAHSVRVRGKPSVPVRTGAVPKDPKTAGSDLKSIIVDQQSIDGEIPVELRLIYLDTPTNGPVVTTSIELPSENLSYGADGKATAQVTLAGIVLDEDGKTAVGFGTGLKVEPARERGSKLIFNRPSPVKPGIYQVRVAARDNQTGKVGSANRWIVVPDLSSRELALSSLLLGVQDVGKESPNTRRLQWSVDQKFSRASSLNILGFVYNAARSVSGSPDLSSRVLILREGHETVATSRGPISFASKADTTRITFSTSIELNGLSPGRYVLSITVEDRVSRKNVSQQTTFFVE